MDIEVIKDQICDVCHKMWQLGWVAANDGNVSAKLDDGTILATPTGMSKSFITPDKLIRIDSKGNVLEAAEGLRPSSEIKMHLRCYDKRDDVMSVIHAHPPGATGFAVAHKAMDMYNMIEDVAAIGAVPLTPYGTPSTTEVPDAIEPYLEEHDVMLLENHGALAVGSDVITAFYRMESLLTQLSSAEAMILTRKIFKSLLTLEAITELQDVIRDIKCITLMMIFFTKRRTDYA